MKATLSHDGVKRVNLNVPVRMSLYEMAECLTARYLDDAPTAVQAMSKAETLTRVRQYLASNGDGTASYEVGDSNLNDELDKVAAILKQRFRKEFE